MIYGLSTVMMGESGVSLDSPPADGRMTLFPGFGQRYDKPGVAPAVSAYAALARRYGMMPAELAIAFVASRPFVASTIVGATTLAQLDANLKACTCQLAPEVLAAIDVLHLKFTNPAP